MSRVTWGSVIAVAEEIDKAYKSKMPSGRKGGPSCTEKPVTSNLDPGIPELMKDITTPFPIKFPIAKTLYQRFEFAYYEDKYQQYKSGNGRPVYHSEYLTGSLSAAATSYITPGALGLGVESENVCNLIESKQDKMWKWWGEKCEYYAKSPTIAAELYFVTNTGSMCPCPGMYRVAYAVGGGKNGNGNGGGPGGKHFTPSGAVHTWTLKSATTLEQIDFDKLKPEDGASGAATYAVPPTGCCSRMVFPKLGLEGGGQTTMYDGNMFYPDYQNAGTKPFTPLVSDMSVKIYEERNAAGSLPKHVAANNATMYDSVSKHESWKVCKEGIAVGVRITPLKFEWGTPTNRRVSIVWCPTSVTTSLSGQFEPAIRKRWYDMMYYKLRHTVGCFGPGEDYATGTTWKTSGESALGSYDQACSRYLAKGYGWEKHEKAEFVGAAYYGEKFMEQFICVKNYQGSIKCNGKGGGAYNDNFGCYCSEESGKRDECRDLACARSIPMPWAGGCANKDCGGNFKTHKASIDYLKQMATFVNEHKEAEPINSLISTIEWKSCAVKYKQEDSHTLTYGSNITHTYGKLTYYDYEYEDEGCSGCSAEDMECPISAKQEGTGTSCKLTVIPKADVAVYAGMAYTTILKPSGKDSIELRVKGSMSKLLMPGKTWKIVGGAASGKPCMRKDEKVNPSGTPEGRGAEVLVEAGKGGVIIIKAAYGPKGAEGMVTAGEPISWEREDEEKTDLDETIKLKFDTSIKGQYRCNIVVYVEVWIAGKGKNNPFTLVTSEGGCFKAEKTDINISIS